MPFPSRNRTSPLLGKTSASNTRRSQLLCELGRRRRPYRDRSHQHGLADALQKSLHELGVVGITAQDINAVAMNGINAVVKFNRMKRRIVTSTEPIVLSANRVKIYILIQVQRNVNGPDDFYSLNTANFKDTSFNKKMKATMPSSPDVIPSRPASLCPAWHSCTKAVWGRGFFLS